MSRSALALLIGLLWLAGAMQPTKAAPSMFHGADVNRDGMVNLLDLVAVSAAYRSADPAADINADGEVDLLDLVAVAIAYGQGTQVWPTPLRSEPHLPAIIRGEISSTVMWEGGEDVSIDSDIDADGMLETIYVGRDHPNGTMLLVVNGEDGYNLGWEITGLDESGFLAPGSCAQLATLDVTRDGRLDLLFALYDGVVESHLNIWQFDTAKWLASTRGQYINPFAFTCDIAGTGDFFVIPGGRIDVVRGYCIDQLTWDGTTFVPVP